MRPPIVRPIPYTNESPGSLLLRASELNGWKSVNKFLNTYKVIPRGPLAHTIFTDKTKWSLALKNLGINVVSKDRNMYQKLSISARSFLDFYGFSVEYNQLRLKEPAICSHCVAESHHASKLWDLRIIKACSKHQTLLIDSCPNCKMRLQWNRPGLLKCKCGQKLISDEIDTIQAKNTSYIENLIKSDDRINFLRLHEIVYQVQNFFDVFDLNRVIDKDVVTVAVGIIQSKKSIMRILNHVINDLANIHGVHPRISLFPFLCVSVKRVDKSFTQILDGFEYCNFPVLDIAFCKKSLSVVQTAKALGVNRNVVLKFVNEGILSAYKIKNNSSWRVELNSINHLLVLLSSRKEKLNQYVPLLKARSNPKGKNDVVSLVKGAWQGKKEFSSMDNKIGIYSVRIEHDIFDIEDENLITMKDAAKLCQTTYESIRAAVNKKLFNKVEPKNPKGSTVFIEKKEVIEFNKKYIFSGTAARNMGVNQTNIADKLKAMGLTPISGPGIDFAKTYLFDRKEVEKVNVNKLINLKNYPTKTGRKNNCFKKFEPKYLTIYYAEEKLGISAQKIRTLLRNGYLEKKRGNGRCNEITKKSLNHIYKILYDKLHISLVEAFAQTNETKKQFYRRWVSTGFINIIDIKINKFVTKKDLKKVIKFKEKYVTSEEAGVMTNTNRSYLPNLEKIGKITTVKKLQGSGQAVKFFLKTDIEKMIRSE